MKLKSDHNLGEILREYRKRNNLSLEKIAEKLYETKQGYHKKEKGLVSWKLDTVRRLSSILGLEFIIKNNEIEIREDDVKMPETKKIMKEERKVMKVKDFGNYSIIKLYSNSEHGTYGNIFDSLEDALNERDEALKIDLTSKIMEGYAIYDNRTEYIPDDAKDWHYSLDSAEKEYENDFRFKVSLNMSEIRVEIIEYLNEHVEDMAFSHIEAWKDRYWGKSLEDIEFDVKVNHDISSEYNYMEHTLNIKLNSEERKYIKFRFNKEVVSLFKNGFTHFL